MKRIAILLVLLTGCIETSEPTIGVVLFRDPECGPQASEDCLVIVPPGARVALPTSSFELIVHSDGELGDVAILSQDRPVEPLAIDRDVNAGGTDVTLLVSPLSFGRVECNEYELEAIDPDRALRYGSGFASNCYCAFCTKYCTVDGQTFKSGTCC